MLTNSVIVTVDPIMGGIIDYSIFIIIDISIVLTASVYENLKKKLNH